MKRIALILSAMVLAGCSSGDFSGKNLPDKGTGKASDANTKGNIGANSTGTGADAASDASAANGTTQIEVQTDSTVSGSNGIGGSCPSGQYVSGIHADGTVQCNALPPSSQTTVIQQIAAPAPSCYMETTRWVFDILDASNPCKQPCGNGGKQSGACTLISSTCSTATKTGSCTSGAGSRMCCK